jgi:hypothetical protein
VSPRVIVPLALSFALALSACASPEVQVTIDGAPLHVSRSSGSLRTETDRTVVELSVSDDGPPNVTDAGITYQFRLELAPGLAAGTALDVEGTATLDGHDTGGSPFERAFAAGPTHDARVLGVSAVSLCFCGGVATHFEEAVAGHVDVVDVDGRMVLVVDLVFDGLVPGSYQSQRIHVTGRFTATLPTR